MTFASKSFCQLIKCQFERGTWQVFADKSEEISCWRSVKTNRENKQRRGSGCLREQSVVLSQSTGIPVYDLALFLKDMSLLRLQNTPSCTIYSIGLVASLLLLSGVCRTIVGQHRVSIHIQEISPPGLETMCQEGEERHALPQRTAVCGSTLRQDQLSMGSSDTEVQTLGHKNSV